MTNFKYCPLVYRLSSANSLKRIENLQKRALRFFCNDYEISHDELLSKSTTSSMNIKKVRALCVSYNYKTISKLKPNFMRDYVRFRLVILYVNVHALPLYYDRHEVKLQNKKNKTKKKRKQILKARSLVVSDICSNILRSSPVTNYVQRRVLCSNLLTNAYVSVKQVVVEKCKHWPSPLPKLL